MARVAGPQHEIVHADECGGGRRRRSLSTAFSTVCACCGQVGSLSGPALGRGLRAGAGRGSGCLVRFSGHAQRPGGSLVGSRGALARRRERSRVWSALSIVGRLSSRTCAPSRSSSSGNSSVSVRGFSPASRAAVNRSWAGASLNGGTSPSGGRSPVERSVCQACVCESWKNRCGRRAGRGGSPGRTAVPPRPPCPTRISLRRGPRLARIPLAHGRSPRIWSARSSTANGSDQTTDCATPWRGLHGGH